MDANSTRGGPYGIKELSLDYFISEAFDGPFPNDGACGDMSTTRRLT